MMSSVKGEGGRGEKGIANEANAMRAACGAMRYFATLQGRN